MKVFSEPSCHTKKLWKSKNQEGIIMSFLPFWIFFFFFASSYEPHLRKQNSAYILVDVLVKM